MRHISMEDNSSINRPITLPGETEQGRQGVVPLLPLSYLGRRGRGSMPQCIKMKIPQLPTNVLLSSPAVNSRHHHQPFVVAVLMSTPETWSLSPAVNAKTSLPVLPSDISATTHHSFTFQWPQPRLSSKFPLFIPVLVKSYSTISTKAALWTTNPIPIPNTAPGSHCAVGAASDAERLLLLLLLTTEYEEWSGTLATEKAFSTELQTKTLRVSQLANWIPRGVGWKLSFCILFSYQEYLRNCAPRCNHCLMPARPDFPASRCLLHYQV
jgi:hypothetical protein